MCLEMWKVVTYKYYIEVMANTSPWPLVERELCFGCPVFSLNSAVTDMQDGLSKAPATLEDVYGFLAAFDIANCV